ncbi:MAG: protein kinase [Deltaproteobacteria bacterium]|nr:protein kinase [Deltaproteobacteria bacterium]MBP7289194.1 protein kinase [Nannocystaceae bacterium]
MSVPSQSRAGSGSSADGFPQLFGKYVLVRQMARGGMGELFLAAAGERGFEKPCVVKKVLHNLDDAGVHRRFLDEAKVVVRLNHANLVQVFDAGRVNDEYYLAMELVEGKDLRAVWNRCAQLHRRIPVDVAMHVVREVLRGLSYVHDAMGLDLVHRDISPPNLLMGYRGEVKLTDFGLAKSAIKREMTSPGVVFGRYSYLSPEQAKGLPADRRTDIYACGIVLWELLTGRQLFPSNNRTHQEALAAVRNPSVRAPSELVPGIPVGLDDVLLQALAADPAERYQTAGEFRVALSEILARDFPSCDADRISEFMREIFAREYKVEGRDYAQLAQQDFKDLRARASDSEAISISDVIALEGGPPATRTANSTITLGESDIVELDAPGARPAQVPNAKSLRESAQSWVGQVVAQRYRVEGLIGIGGMGAVFRVTHLALGKTFALKVLHSIYTRDADIITRFMREARAATQTGHPNIIDVTDIGTTESGDVYLVMELLEGQHLGATIRQQGPLAIRRAVHIARQICRALSAAHEVGIIHRDLKSENVILTPRGKDPDFVKVLDFGICKHVNADASTTSPGLVMGSPDYMAPEQGAGLDATVASDVYAVGCILFEMVTGRLPFEGRNAIDVLMQKGAREAVRATAYRPELPEPLADVIARCLARASALRPPSMRALEYELTRAVDGRASAVANVLGLQAAGDSLDGVRMNDDPSPAASASFHRAAIAAIDAPPSGYVQPERTVIAPPPRAPVAAPPSGREDAEAHRRPSAAAAAGKALLFVALGGLVAAAALLAVAPELLDRVRGEPSPAVDEHPATLDERTHAPDDRKPGEAPVVEDASGGDTKHGRGPQPTEREDATPPRVSPGPDDAAKVPTPSIEPPAPTPHEDWLGLAQAAVVGKHWREPAEGSLAVALTNLAIAEPGNAAIAKLRQQAADDILPGAIASLERRQWTEAAEGFRDLVAVWPEHPEARTGLADALFGQARILKRHKDHAAVLATADELLNVAPGDFRALMLRAESLMALRRYGEAKDAYGEARKQKPRNKDVAKGFWKAAALARKDG